jgi:DNA helicase II / ATP-dependent DNA helicase PcrA
VIEMENKKFKPSKYQKAIYSFIENGKGNAVVEAVAGSGKTTTIVEATSRIPPKDRAIFVAFNKSIATELSKKLQNKIEGIV